MLLLYEVLYRVGPGIHRLIGSNCHHGTDSIIRSLRNLDNLDSQEDLLFSLKTKIDVSL